MKYIIDVPDGTKWIEAYYAVDHLQYQGKTIIVDSLTPYTEPDLNPLVDEAVETIENEVWEFAKIFMDDMGVDDLEVVNGDTIKRYFAMTYQEAKAKYEAWKKKKDEIRVGDEVETESGNKACVLYENPDGTQMFIFKADGTAAWWSKCAIHKTGKNHQEVAELLEKMRGGE